MGKSPRTEATDGDTGPARERDAAGHSGASEGESPGEDLEAVLDLGRQFLEASVGAVLRVDSGHSRIVASTAEGPLEQARIDEAAVSETVETAGAVVRTDQSDGDAMGWYLGHRVTLDGEVRGVVCFTDEEQRGTDEAERAIVGVLARLVAAELADAATADAAWTDRELTETLLDTVPDLLYAFSADGTIVQWNDEMEAVTGYDTADIATMGPLDFFVGEDRNRVAAAVSGVEAGETVTVEADLVTADGEAIPYQFNGAPVTSNGEVVGFAGVGRDISEYRDHEETLTELHDVTRELVSAETETAICERVVTAATELLDISVVGLFLFDDEANVLRLATHSDGAEEVVGEVPSFGPGEGIAWEAFMRGEVTVYDDVREAEAVYNPETAIRSELFVPLGEHGILLAGSTATASFDDRTVELAGLLAANAEAALDNVARKRDLADRDAELERQHRRLERLNEVNERVRRIGHALVGADTPGEIAALVCERLAVVDRFAFVCLTGGAATDEVTVRSQAGRDGDYVDAVRTAARAGTTAPLWQAARTGERAVVDPVADDFQGEPWRREALSRDFRAVAAFPLNADGVPRGTLAVYADAAGTFDDETLSVLDELADMVAEAMGVAQRQRAAAADELVELVVRVDPGPCPVGALADRLGADLTVTRVVPQSGDRCLVYGTAAADAAAVEGAIAATPDVDEGRVVTETPEGVRFELATTGRTLADSVRRFGGTADRVDVGDDGARLVARLSPSSDVREFVSLLEGDYADVEVLAQRTVPKTDGDDPLGALTDRQREALLAAYDAGFFEWPRESSGEEVAGDLSVSQPTFVEHLRRAQSNLFGSLLDR